MSRQIKIAVAESSEIIRAGIISVLRKLNNTSASFIEIEDTGKLKYILSHHFCDVLIVNPLLAGFTSLPQLRNEAQNARMKLVALQTVLCNKSELQHYDEVVSVFDTADQIRDRLSRVLAAPGTDKPSEVLSGREKEIVSYVVNGMSNKQIADKLCLSVHTVVTHRRNIANKLDIHTTSGLTIYAIVNKLVEITNLRKD